jgi:hypothetical protein
MFVIELTPDIMLDMRANHKCNLNPDPHPEINYQTMHKVNFQRLIERIVEDMGATMEHMLLILQQLIPEDVKLYSLTNLFAAFQILNVPPTIARSSNLYLAACQDRALHTRKITLEDLDVANLRLSTNKSH